MVKSRRLKLILTRLIPCGSMGNREWIAQGPPEAPAAPENFREAMFSVGKCYNGMSTILSLIVVR